MTIYGSRYRQARYEATTTWQRLAPLVQLERNSLFRNRWGVVVFLLCLAPVVVRLILLLIWSGALAMGGPARRVRGMNSAEWSEFMPDRVDFYVESVVAPEQGLMVFLVLTALVTARAIARDRTTNALELYWTRGISPMGYFLAKWFGSFQLTALITVVAPLALWLTGVLVAEDWSFLGDTAGFMPRALAGLVLFTGVLTAICILFSAIAGTPNLAAILWCLLLGGSSAVGHLVADFTNRSGIASSISVFDAAGALARAIAGIPQRGVSVTGAVTLLAIVLLLLVALTMRRLRLREAVG